MNMMLQTGRMALRRLVLPLLCLPFLLAQLVAPGTMAVGGPDGLRMVLCSGDGLMTVVLTDTGDIVPVDDADDGHGASGATCPWSLAFDKSAMAAPLHVAQTIAAPVRHGLSWDHHPHPPIIARQNPPVRAPPFTV